MCCRGRGECEFTPVHIPSQPVTSVEGEGEHLFSLGANGVARRPGILVLINDADWELEGEDGYEIREGDNILFVSTLHGG